MIKYTKIFVTLLLALIVFQARSQSTATTSSPYSRFGLGDISPQVLPQNLGMGDISVATNNFSGYYNINPLNPASYGKIGFDCSNLTNAICRVIGPLHGRIATQRRRRHQLSCGRMFVARHHRLHGLSRIPLSIL